MSPQTSPTAVNQLPSSWPSSKKFPKYPKKRWFLHKIPDKDLILQSLSKNRMKVWLALAALTQVLLLYITYRHHLYTETVKLNRRTLSRGEPPADAWWRHQNLTIWTIWIGDDLTPPPVIQAAMQSCRTVHENDPNLNYQVITNDDLHTLDFELHPSFWLLDNVEKSDYLRGELLHHYGGFYMDADMLCLTSFSLRGNYIASAAQDRTKYGPWPSVSQNAFGPFQAHSALTQKWHDTLMETMNSITPQLQQCAQKYAPEPIPYPTSRRWGYSLCGVEWGGVIDFVKPLWLEYFEKQQFGHDLSMCNVYGQHLGWDDYPLKENCDIIHLGTAGDFYERKLWDMAKLCQELPALYGSRHCTLSES